MLSRDISGIHGRLDRIVGIYLAAVRKRVSLAMLAALCGVLLTGSAGAAQFSGQQLSSQQQSATSPADPAAPTAPTDLRPWLREIPLKTGRSGILPEESETYYHMLGLVRDLDPAAVSAAAREFLAARHQQSRYRDKPLAEFPVFFDMYQHPEAYQGRPVTMRGHIQRSVNSPAGQNDAGVAQLCELWLFTDDSQAHPTVVVSTQFPPGFPIGEQTIDHVTVTGYIYRMYTYEARDTGRYAPLLIANRIEWAAPVADRSWIGLIVGAFVLIGLAGLLARVLNSRRPARSVTAGLELPATIVSLPDDRSEVKLPQTRTSRSLPETRFPDTH